MAITNHETAVYQRSWSDVYQAALDAIPTLKRTKVKSADAATGRIVASTGVSMTSWGEDVTIEVWEHAPGWAGIRITSGVKAQLVDWGRNKKNIGAVFDAISGVLGVAPQPMPQPQAGP